MKWCKAAEFGSKENWICCLREVICSDVAIQTCRHLFPRSLSDCSSEEQEKAKEYLTDTFEMGPAEISLELDIGFDEILRLFLVLQHNGFDSGLYRFLTVVNHSCRPNCIKYAPTSASHGASEIWTTEFVPAGQELLICYVEPIGQSPLSVRDYLSSSHGFSCGCRHCSFSFDCSVSSIEINLGIKLNEWQSKLDMLEKRLPMFQKQVVTCLSKLEQQRMSGGQEDESAEFLALHNRMKTYIFRMLKIKEDIANSRVMIHPEITKFMYRRLIDNLIGFLELFLDLTTNYYEQNRNVGDTTEILDSVAKALVLSFECKLDGAIIECFGPTHPLVATALLDLANSMDRVMQLSRLSGGPGVEMLQTVANNCPSHLLRSHSTSLQSFQAYRQRIWEYGESIRKLYVTARHFPEAVRAMCQGRPGQVFWANALPINNGLSDVIVESIATVFGEAGWSSSEIWDDRPQGADVENMTVAEWIDSLNILMNENEDVTDASKDSPHENEFDQL